MTFRFLQTSRLYLYRKEHMTIYPKAKSYIGSMISQHPSVKTDGDGLPIVEINSIEELTKFIEEECDGREIVVGHNAVADGWYIEDYDTFRE